LHGTKGALRVETNGKHSRLSACLGDDIDTSLWQDVPLEPIRRNARRFVDALLSGEDGEPSFRRAADIQRVIDSAFASDRTGKAVEIA
jgi:predicted dehydrogenase